MAIVLNRLNKAKILSGVLGRLGRAGAPETGSPNVTPEPSKMGCDSFGNPVVGVDYAGGKYRARIRCCSAQTGMDVRITLIRTDSLDEAAYAYRAAHVVLWGSASWAADDDILHLLGYVR